MAALEIQGNGDSGTLGNVTFHFGKSKKKYDDNYLNLFIFLLVTEDHINRTIESLEQDETPLHDFIRKCLHHDPNLRPTAQELLFHPVLFEVPSLKLLSAHALLKAVGCQNLCKLLLPLPSFDISFNLTF